MNAAGIAKVVVEQAAYHFDKPFDYLIPPDLRGRALPGCRVLVPFGKGNRKRQGMILALAHEGEIDRLKPIHSLLDEEPPLSKEMLRLGVFLREHTFCTYFEAFRALFPAGIGMRLVASYRAAVEEIPEGLQGEEARLLSMLLRSRATVERGKLLELMGLDKDSDLPDQMVKKKLLCRVDSAVRRLGDASVRMVRPVPDADPPARLTAKQEAVMNLLSEVGAASMKELCYFTGTSGSVITGLIKKGILEDFEQEVYRNPYADRQAESEQTVISLTREQEKAYTSLLPYTTAKQGQTALLYGVTGSGKTQVFLKLIDSVIQSGRSVIVMVPEIALTPQTLDIFHRRYGGKIAVFHSAMALGQRMDEWKRVKRGEARIAIGTRSAVFAPFDDLGLIIMDEEQEHTYKSENAPKFHARDVARFRARYHGCLLVLASATPSLESYSAAMMGKYALCTLEKRYGNATLPEVVTVDMCGEQMAGNTGVLSRRLADELQSNLNAGRQSILLLNRRGRNTYVSCAACGYVESCPNCSISLTYHSANHRLLCHYCGHSREFTQQCPQCGRPALRYAGAGTQKAEEELRALFPGARILRMDADTTMTRNAHEELLSAFGNGEYDILLGTQMVAKGLDFSNVTLVGVIGADNTLFGDDFRASERTFSLLTQVVGRSGRGEQAGIAVVQTIAPQNAVIRLAAAQDYKAFYSAEIQARRLLVYPPYCDICVIGFVGEDKDEVKAGAQAFFGMLKRKITGEYGDVKLIALGPGPAAVSKIAGKFRYRIILKCKNNRRLRELISVCLSDFGRSGVSKTITAFADMNPDSIL